MVVGSIPTAGAFLASRQLPVVKLFMDLTYTFQLILVHISAKNVSNFPKGAKGKTKFDNCPCNVHVHVMSMSEGGGSNVGHYRGV